MKTIGDFNKLLYPYTGLRLNNPEVDILINNILVNHPDFYTHSGSGYEGQHHYGDGGLADHTYEVLEYCISNAKISSKKIDFPVLILAALYHDIGKLWDYKKVAYTWIPAEHKRNIHHISKSAMIFYEQANKAGLNEKTRESVLHCILSHHTTRAYGSPVAPNSREAWILTLCDNMSARLDDCDTWDYLKKK